MDTVPRNEDRLSRRVRFAIIGVLASVIIVTLAIAASAMSWRSGLVADQRLLPGTTIAGLSVGGTTADEAAVAVRDLINGRLRQQITVVDGDQQWRVTPAELGLVADVDAALAQAGQVARDVGIVDVVRMRFLGWEGARAFEVPISTRGNLATSFIREIAKDVDVAAVDAVLTWDGDSFVVEPSVTARSVDRAAAASALRAAAQAGDDRVDLPVVEQEPSVTTDMASATAEQLEPLVRSALDRTITAEVAGRRWRATAGELGAAPDLESLLPTAFEQEVSDIPLAIDQDALADFVSSIAADVDVPAVSAKGSWRGGTLHVTGHELGRSLDVDAAMATLTAVITGGETGAELRMRDVKPALTSSSWDTFVLVHQRKFTATLYRDGSIVKSWPIAVGADGYRTPNGNFVVGAKRFMPTWTNPAPTTWGRHEPAFIGPGPNNPLGLRALNWNRVGGGDTLIRFHGTPARDSIGTAASHGCVRMLNEHVIEVYDLVPAGTPILAVGRPAPPGPEDEGEDDEAPPTEGA